MNDDLFIFSEDGKELLKVLDKKIKAVTIPKGIEMIGGYAFRECVDMERVDIPEGVTWIGYEAFGYCRSLREIVLPEGVTDIRDYAFNGCSSLQYIVIPDSVTYIGFAAFDDCYSLLSINIPNSVTCIEDGAFYGCTSLKNIHVTSGNSEYASQKGVLFSKGLSDIHCMPMGQQLMTYKILEGVNFICDYAFYGCSSLKSIYIPQGVSYIGNGVFLNCTSLQSIDIPNTMTSIGRSTFVDCSSLQNIHVASDNSKYASLDGVLYNKDFSEILCMPMGMSRAEYKIPDTVTIIGEEAFRGCDFLQSVDIPSSVISIMNSAFRFCKCLKSIHLHHNNLSVCEIEEESFDDLIYSQCALYITHEAQMSALNHPIFSKFKNIVTEQE